jgi:hypothetical protein
MYGYMHVSLYAHIDISVWIGMPIHFSNVVKVYSYRYASILIHPASVQRYWTWIDNNQNKIGIQWKIER